jgi:hypothetical protein
VGRSSARLRALAIFLAISLLPTLLWMGRGGQVGGESLSRGLAMNERGLEQLGRGISIVADWLLPGRVVEPVRSDLTRGLLIGWLALIVWSLLARRSDRRRGVRASASYLPELLALFVVFYSGVLVAVRLFVVPGVSISPRIFSLGQAALISLTACALTEAYDRFGAWRAARALRRSVAARSALALGLLAAVAVPAAVNATHTLEFSRRVHAEGLGYAAPAWNAAPVIRYLADLPAATAIVSNGPDVIFFQTGRPARMLPQWPYDDPEGSVFRPDLAAEVSHRVEPGDVLVFFRGFAWRGGMSERQIKRAFSLSPLIGDDNGSAYRVEAVTLPAAFELEGEDGRGSEMFMAEVRRRAVVSPKEAERGA